MLKNKRKENINQILLRISNLMILNILWVVFSIPIFTIGASTTALYDGLFETKEKKAKDIIYEFKNNFKNKFFKSTISWIMILFIIIIFIMEGRFFFYYKEKNIEIIKYILYLGVLIFLISIQYIFLLISKMYEKSLKELYYFSFFLGMKNIWWSILTILYFSCSIILFVMFQEIFIILWPIYVLIGFSIVGYFKIKSFNKIKKVLKF